MKIEFTGRLARWPLLESAAILPAPSPEASTVNVLAILVVVAAYLLGSISFAVVVSRAFGLPDPHEYGSRNPGATNVLRTGNRRAALLTLLGDGLKGFVAVLAAKYVAQAFGLAEATVALAAVAVFAGHVYPVFHGFRGGKGVATSLGAVAALDGFACLMAVIAFGTFLIMTRIVSLSSMLAAVVFTLAHFYRVADPWSAEHWALSAATLALLVLLIARHRTNIVRILNGTEPRIRSSRKGRNTGGSANGSRPSSRRAALSCSEDSRSGARPRSSRWPAPSPPISATTTSASPGIVSPSTSFRRARSRPSTRSVSTAR